MLTGHAYTSFGHELLTHLWIELGGGYGLLWLQIGVIAIAACCRYTGYSLHREARKNLAGNLKNTKRKAVFILPRLHSITAP